MGGTPSGTYTFNPAAEDLVIEAFERCLITAEKLTKRHLTSARMSANLVLEEWASRGLSLWIVEQITPIPLLANQAVYNLPTNIINVLDLYITQTDGSGNTTDRIIRPLGRSDYAGIANKTATGAPASFWFYRGVQPQLTLWNVPDFDDTYVLNGYAMRRIQDVNPGMGQTTDLNYRFFGTFAAFLAQYLSEKWAPQLYERLEARSEKLWLKVGAEDTEKVDLFITPQLMGYYGG